MLHPYLNRLNPDKVLNHLQQSAPEKGITTEKKFIATRTAECSWNIPEKILRRAKTSCIKGYSNNFTVIVKSKTK